MSARAMQLREGIAPTRDRLTTTVFMAALVHGVIIVGVTFGGVQTRRSGAPGLEVLIVSDDVPEARRNDDATYLAQRTQLGSGNSAIRARSRARRAPPPNMPRAMAAIDGTVLADDAGALLATADNRALTTTAPMPEILYFAPPASDDRDDRGAGADRRQQRTRQARHRRRRRAAGARSAARRIVGNA